MNGQQPAIRRQGCRVTPRVLRSLQRGDRPTAGDLDGNELASGALEDRHPGRGGSKPRESVDFGGDGYRLAQRQQRAQCVLRQAGGDHPELQEPEQLCILGIQAVTAQWQRLHGIYRVEAGDLDVACAIQGAQLELETKLPVERLEGRSVRSQYVAQLLFCYTRLDARRKCPVDLLGRR
ncbi:hypothetical protein D3C78_1212710 [compost metagenome]